MPNIFWYYGFVVIGAGIMAYTIYKKKHAGDMFAFLLAAIAMSFVGEYVILFIFEGYMYKPAVFADPFANNVVGHVIPNASLWGTTAVLVGAFRLRYRWIALIGVIFMLIEVLFLQLDLYEHSWWKIYMTGAAIMIFFPIAKISYAKLAEKRHPVLRNVTFALLGVVVMHTPSIIFLIMKMQYYHVGWVSNQYRESILFGVLYHAFISVFILSAAHILKNRYLLAVPLAVIFVCDSLLWKLGIMVLQNGLTLGVVFAATTVSFITVLLFEQYTLKPNCT